MDFFLLLNVIISFNLKKHGWTQNQIIFDLVGLFFTNLVALAEKATAW